jgi:hypothetical protein
MRPPMLGVSFKVLLAPMDSQRPENLTRGESIRDFCLPSGSAGMQSLSHLDVSFRGATFAGILNGIPVGGLNDINAGGQIAGTYFDSNSVPHGFRDDHGLFSKVDVPLPGTCEC